MKLIFPILVFAANMVFRDGSIPGSIFLAIILTVALSIALEIMSRAKRQSRRAHQGQTANQNGKPPPGRTARAKSAPLITDGDIGPYVKSMLERGDHERAGRLAHATRA